MTTVLSVSPRRRAVPLARRRRRPTLDTVSFMIVFLGVPLIIYVVFVLSPFLQAVWYSLTDWSGFTDVQSFVGVANFARILGDSTFLIAVRNNLVLAVVLPAATLVVALTLAVLVTVGGSEHGTIRGLRGSGFYRVVSFFPYVIPAIVIGIMWRLIYDPSSGFVNGVLTGIGLGQFRDFAWLGDSRTAMAATILVIVWSLAGFYMVLFVAAIKGIPQEIYEAARLDGAGRLRTAVSITLPLIRDNVQTAWVYLGILGLDAFVYMAAMNPSGGPDNSTLVMAQHLFTTAFRGGQFGVACAMGVVLAALTLVFSVIVFGASRLLGGWED